MPPEDAKSYHHGDLRSALVTAALDVLERDGPEALSLRALARSVGVSPMAPYHHFPDRTALLAAVATAGFERLQDSKTASKHQASSTKEALISGAAGYVRFILDNPNLYRLMKGPAFADSPQYPELQRAAAMPAQMLIALVSTLFAEADAVTVSADEAARMLWALAHGVGMLALDRQLDPKRAPDLAAAGATAIIDGWLSPQPARYSGRTAR
jgi:AcrR family transcriptional regulator